MSFNQHYYSEKQESELKENLISVKIRDFNLNFYVAGGVFSSRRIDNGTFLLSEKMLIKKDWTVLDIGCGYGVLGIVASKLKAKVILTDVNERACYLAEKNLKANRVKGKVLSGNLYDPIKKSFDCILSNPPQTAGKNICFAIIEGAKEHLKKNGVFYLVARHNKGGKNLSGKMESVFGNLETVAKSKGFRVYLSKAL